MSRFWMVAYDINDDSVRRRIAGLLKDHGERVQYSVFECRLEEGLFLDLRRQLTQLLEPGDSLRWYPLCRWCRETVSCQGDGQKTLSGQGFVIL